MSRPKLTEEEKEVRRKHRELAKRKERIEQEKLQRPVKEITISIEWKKSRTWGYNPYATAEVRFKENEHGQSSFEHHEGFACSGCGYDKESTVIAQIFNQFLKYKLYRMTKKKKEKKPYGIRFWSDNGIESCYFEGGVGTSCYYAISEFLYGKFEKIASGKTFDVYKYTDNSKS